MKHLSEIAFRSDVRLVYSDLDGAAFFVPFKGNQLKVIASHGEGWDHVSVSLPKRTPTWEEMEYVKRLFFKEDEVAYQLHVPPKDHINIHPHVLHIWRPQQVPVPLPPTYMV